MQKQPGAGLVRILVEVLDPLGVERAGPADQAVDLVALGQQEFGQIGAILSGDAGNQRPSWIIMIPLNGHRGRRGVAWFADVVPCVARPSFLAVASYQATVSRRPSTNDVLGAKAELGCRPGGVEAAPRLAVRLGTSPSGFPRRTGRFADQFDQLADRDLLAGTDVDRLRLVVELGGRRDRPAASRTNRNSREALPVPQTSMNGCPASRASTALRISAGITWLDSGSKLSPGP